MARGVELSGFGGLVLRDDPDDVALNGALDIENVSLYRRGAIDTRWGLTPYFTSGTSSSARIMFAWPTSDTDMIVVSDAAANISVYLNGILQGSTATAGATYRDFVSFGTTTNVGYLAQASGTIQKITPAGVLTTPAGMPSALALAVQTPDNRLVTGTGNRVSFSDAGAPETFGATNWVDLEPNDGDTITAMASWNNLVFVFKHRKFYVFYGNSVDGSGNPVFNYRRVSGETGAFTENINAKWRSVAVASDGVYFVNDNGIYRTTGSTPVKISSALDPLFAGLSPGPAYGGRTGAAFDLGGITICDGKLILHSGATLPVTEYLVYDFSRDVWTRWTLPAVNQVISAVVNDSGVKAERLLTLHSNNTDPVIRYMSPNATTDDTYGVITARYRTGFWQPGQPGAETWVREIILNGSGTVTVKRAVNDATTLGTGQTVTLATSPAVSQGRDRRGHRGRNVSYEFSGSAPWSLSQVQPIIWGQRATAEAAP